MWRMDVKTASSVFNQHDHDGTLGGIGIMLRSSTFAVVVDLF